MESSRNNPPAPIDILGTVSRFLKVFSKLWVLMVLLAILFGAKEYFSSKVTYTPMYECECLFSVGSTHSSSDIFSTGTFYSNTTAAQTMVKSFPTLLSTEFMRDLILAQLDKDYINGSISSSSIEGTNLVQLTVTSSDPQDAYDILNAVLVAYPKAAVYLVSNPAIEMRQEPTVPTQPFNQHTVQRSWRGGAVKGAVLGCLIIVLLALLNQTVVSADEVTKILNLPIVGKLPRVSIRKRRNSPPTLLNQENNPALAEAIRSLRTKVHRSAAKAQGNVILLTSTVPGEGKTTVSCNLALSLAAEGHRVVLVDADLRKQSVLKLFAPTEVAGKGLLYCLHNPNAPLTDVIRHLPNSDLHYISGGVTQKRHYSIDPRSMKRVLAQLSRDYDYVVVDTPPCGVVSDTRMLCHHADCIFYVVKIDGAHKLLISDSVAALHQQGVTLDGVIVNGIPRHKIRTDYGYAKKYGRSRT